MKLNINFAYEGFRLIRQNPAAILFWGIVLVIGNTLTFGSALYLAWPTIQNLVANGMPEPDADPQAFLAMLGRFTGPYFAALLISLVVQAILVCAILRSVFSGTVKGFGNVQLGQDEVRMFLVMLVLGFVLFLINLASGLVGGLIGWLFSGLIGAGGGKAMGDFLGFVGYMYFVARFSLAYAQSFDEKRFNPFGSWGLTQKTFGQLLPGYLVMVILAAVVAILCLVVFVVVASFGMASHGDLLSQLNDKSSPAEIVRIVTALAPWFIGYFAFLSLLVAPLLNAIFVGGPAAAYRQIIAGSQGRNVF